MTEEVTVGTPALVVVNSYKGYACYDVVVKNVTKTGQVTVSYTTRDGFHVTKRFFKRKYSKTYDEVGSRSSYVSPSAYIYFGERIEKERAAILEHRERQEIWEVLQLALRDMPGSWVKNVPSDNEILVLRQKLDAVRSALNRAEHYNAKQALEKTDAPD